MRDCASLVCLAEKTSVVTAPGRRPIAGYQHPMVYRTDGNTAVTKNYSGEITLQQGIFILEKNL
jgi:hypothetical protein